MDAEHYKLAVRINRLEKSVNKLVKIVNELLFNTDSEIHSVDCCCDDCEEEDYR